VAIWRTMSSSQERGCVDVWQLWSSLIVMYNMLNSGK
jgi:hypothetical protein